jgi:hypothetical protein
VFPGADSGFTGLTSELPLVEMVHLSVDGVTALERLDTDGDGVFDDDDIDDDDIDDDNDGILDVTESGGNDPNGDEDGDGIPNYLDVNDDGTGDGSTTDYTDANSDGFPDAYDFDLDGIPNHLDLDSDGDGILDIVEFQTTAGFTAPTGSVGTNGYYDIYETSADSGVAANAPLNTDGTFGADYLDIDSDNDGIPDNVEAQTTLGYTTPTGNVGENGVDSAYENVDTYTPTGINITDTDIDGTVDFRDSDSDNDGTNDIDENGEGNTLSGSDTDGDGLDNNFDADNVNYDVNDNINTPSTDLPDVDGDVNTGGDVDYRDDVTGTDTDDDGIPDTVDLDDDNDGILDTRELCGTAPNNTVNSTITININFDSFSEDITWNLRDPSNAVILTEGPYAAGLATDTGNSIVVTTAGDYTLEVIDAFGDGFVEADGDGLAFIQVQVDGSTVYDTTNAFGNNGAFGSGFTTPAFTISASLFTCINGDPSGDDDSDGTPNYQDADYSTGVGGDTINANGTWTSLDHDGDGVPDHLDLDSDDDGITDNLESQTTAGYVAGVGNDTDNDGVDDAYDPDCTPCGSTTGTEIIPVNSDTDAQPDYKDIDTDDDGIPDNIEAQTALGYMAPNGVPGANGLDSAYDFTDSFASTGLDSTLADTDGTGEPDFRDTDSDDDGIPDIQENGDTDNAVSGTDTDGDGIVDSVDIDDDNDGILDTEEGQITDCSGTVTSNAFRITTTDGATGAVENIDLSGLGVAIGEQVTISNVLARGDIDNAGLTEGFTLNFNSGAFTSGTLLTSGTQCSATLLAVDTPIPTTTLTVIDIGSSTPGITVQATTLSGVGNFCDEDGGTTTADFALEFTVDISCVIINLDTDGDGIPNYLDQDSDNDGILDVVEAQTSAGYIAPTGSVGANGLYDIYETSVDSGTPLFTPQNTDSATESVTLPDYIDIDSDNDGIPDNVEAQSTQGYTAPSGTIGSNGVDVNYELNDSFTATALDPVNTDGTGEPDYRDTDSDDDGTDDENESGITANGGGTADSDGDGLLDTWEGADATAGEAYDVNDEIDDPVNNLLDADGDGSSTGDVDYRDTASQPDTDGDGITDDIDVDDDNDGILDTIEDAAGDADSDGIPNSLDIDSDDDGIPDNIEAQLTSSYIAPSGSGMGITDANMNGLDDNYESGQGGTDITPVNTDSITGNNTDANPDYLDTDTDGDGILDINENGNANSLSGTDTDGDGLDDAFEGVLNDNDVNDGIDDPTTNLPDLDSDVNTADGSQPDAAEYNDVDYRDIDDDRTPPSVVGNILWLRGDIGVTGVGEVTNWADQSGSAFNAIPNGGTGPAKLGDADNGGLNFNPTLQFGTLESLDIVNGILGNSVVYNDLWIYSVNSSTSATTLSNIVNQGVSGATEITYQVPTAGSLFSFNPGTGTALTAAWGGIAGTANNNFNLWNAGFSSDETTPSGSIKTIYRDGLQIATGSDGTTFTSDNSDLTIGSDLLGANLFSGEIAEIMVFTSVPSAIQQQQIQSYLAIKYGITLDQTDNDATIDEGDYILEDLTTVVWDESANSAFHNGVAGIGRDDGMFLNQKQSQSKDTDAIVTLGLGQIAGNNDLNSNAISSNKSFLMWGHNGVTVNSTNTSSVALLCENELQLDRVWKVVETGLIGSVEIAVPQATLDAALTTPTTEVIVLKVADDQNFTTNVRHIPVSTRTVNGTASYVVDFNFDGTKYFTYSEVLGIFWNGDSNAWTGGAGTAGAPTIDPSIDGGKVLVIDAETSGTNAFLTTSANVECLWVKANSKLVVNNDLFIEFDQDFVLDGEVRLIGDAQLVQSHTGLSNVQGSGVIYRDQAATVPNVYRYHYWSSPVTAALGNTTFTVETVMFDGTTPTSENSTIKNINFLPFTGFDSLNGAPTDPITIAAYWIFSYFNGVDRNDWVNKQNTGAINTAEGFIMKSTGRSPQNFTFMGSPNDGDYFKVLNPGSVSLLGNPYPSVINTQQFLTDNDDIIDGTLYFWEHQGESTTTDIQVEGHGEFGYIGGYSQRNQAMGVAANSVIEGTAGLGEGSYTSPPQFIAVGQGFFVSAPANKGGTLRFENNQRAASTDNVFFRNNEIYDDLPNFKLGMDYTNNTNAELHRQLGINFKEGHTFEYENGFDSQVFDLGATDIFWDFDEIDSNLIIAGVGELSTDLQVPLGIQVDSDDPIFIMLDEVNNMEGYTIYLGDLVTGRLYNLQDPVQLDLPRGSYTGRFILLFGGEALSTDDNPFFDDFNVYMNNTTDQLVIRNNNNSLIEKVEIYNMLGQPVKVWNRLDNSRNQHMLDVIAPTAIYVVKVTTDKGEITKKVLVD